MAGVAGALGLFGRRAEAMRAAVPSFVRALSAEDKTRSYPVPDKDGVQIDKENRVILVRWLGSVYAFALSCPHQNTSLTWVEKAEHFQCPKHRSQYSADGYFLEGRATRGMDRYAIIADPKDAKKVIVDLAVLRKETDDKKIWEKTAVTL